MVGALTPARFQSLKGLLKTGYIACMFDVLVYVYEHYWRGDACPELPLLGRKLSAAGFDADEIEQALAWLAGLNIAAQHSDMIHVGGTKTGITPAYVQSPNSMRIYSEAEQQHVGAAGLGFLTFMEAAGVLPAQMREIVVDRAMAVPNYPVSLDDLKIIVLMVYWSAGIEPDALVLDELCDDQIARVAH
jgi:Smg protein